MSFITGTPSHAPTVTPFGYGLLVSLLLSCFFLTHTHYASSRYQRFWRRVQYLQIIGLYGWYLLMHFDLAECLPLFHCRIAALAVLFLPSGKLKTYFAYLGIAGANCALLVPVFDPYPFPHLTILSYVIGHLALLTNSLIYLYLSRDQEVSQLTFPFILKVTLLTNMVIGAADVLLRANYGFLRETILIGSKNGLFNLLVVTTVLSIMVFAVQNVVMRHPEQGLLARRS